MERYSSSLVIREMESKNTDTLRATGKNQKVHVKFGEDSEQWEQIHC